MSCIDESFLLSSAALSVIVFTKYSNKAIDVFVSKLNENIQMLILLEISCLTLIK